MDDALDLLYKVPDGLDLGTEGIRFAPALLHDCDAAEKLA
jgi:hypothetical protein